MNNEERFKRMSDKVDEIRGIYIRAEQYNHSLSLDDKVEGSEDNLQEGNEDIDLNEEEKNEKAVSKMIDDDSAEAMKNRKKYLRDIIPEMKKALKACDPKDSKIVDLKKDIKELEKEYKELVKKTKKARFHYFGFLLYPTKNERHYQIFKRLPFLGVTYAMGFHWKEFEHSVKRIQSECFEHKPLIYDILEQKALGEKFISERTGKEVRLIEPHIHCLMRWDEPVSRESMAKILNLEENLIKFSSMDGKFLKEEYNPLNYLIHLARSIYKYTANYTMDFSTSVEDDIQDRASYDIEDVVAHSKWYKMLVDQASDFINRKDLLFEEFSLWVREQRRLISRYEVRAWFKEHDKYRSYIDSQRECVRPDLLKIVDEHNRDYSEDSFELEDANLSVRSILETYKSGIEDGSIRQYNKECFCPIDMWHSIKTRVEDMLSAQRARHSHIDRSLRVIYVQGDSGSGKTTLAKSLCKSLGYSYVVSGSDNDPLEDYAEQDAIILDDFRGKDWHISEVLKLLDNHTNSKVRSRYHDKDLYYCKLIVITTVWALEQFWSWMNDNEDYKEPKKQFLRRITYVVEPCCDNQFFIVTNKKSGKIEYVENPAKEFVGDEPEEEIPLFSCLSGYTTETPLLLQEELAHVNTKTVPQSNGECPSNPLRIPFKSFDVKPPKEGVYPLSVLNQWYFSYSKLLKSVNEFVEPFEDWRRGFGYEILGE